MYLKSLKIKNFRKFGNENNFVEFVDSKEGLQTDTINIATATTLIVGKNNSGKTTITKALTKLIDSNRFEANDFNFAYLNKLFEEYISDIFEKFPTLEFQMIIGLDESAENQDLITNIVPFMNIEDIESKDFKITMSYELTETTEFIEKVKKIIQDYPDPYLRFQKYIKLINEVEKKLNYHDSNDEIIEKNKFKLSDLVNIKVIAANKIISDTSLSVIFNKIIQYKYKTENLEEINGQIDSINQEMTTRISSTHSEYINGALHAIENKEKLKIRLSSNLNFDILLKQLIRYQYDEQGLYIPEGQFGLGYSNLMSIIGEIIDYIEQYPDEEFHSKLNLICIEEPEAFMHPQMQELFIKNINEAIKHLLDGSTKKINSQLIVTTHSSHILNSKIQTSNSFNNINYITIIDNLSNVVTLNDNRIINLEEFAEIEDETEEEKQDREQRKEYALNNLKFIKKHIKHRVSELFFSDAVIFVEGITEETLLSYYIDQNDELNKYYISIFNINGAHGLVYHNLIRLLKIPTLIITDLDIKRTEEEKKAENPKKEDKKDPEYLQIASLNTRTTTNATIQKYKGNNDISDVSNCYIDENLYITFQNVKIEEYYATSLEESLILQNYDNNILNKVLKKIKPNIYKEIIGEPENKGNLVHNSYKLQKKLSNSKSDFANELLYQLSIKDDGDDIPVLPKYIQDALDWLKSKLSPAEETQEVEA
jgi:putative ATP-dependent endonuclease of the OLD family